MDRAEKSLSFKLVCNPLPGIAFPFCRFGCGKWQSLKFRKLFLQGSAGHKRGILLNRLAMNELAYEVFSVWLTGLGRLALLGKEAVASLFKLRFSWSDCLYQLYFIGVKSQTVVLVTGAFTGMVLCAQTYFQFHKVKMDNATLAVVSVSMCSELGPVLTALMVAGRVGASMAAQIGTMKVTEQIDALRTLATHPVDYLVVPRLVAALVSLPLLTVESISMGILSGYLIGVFLLGIEPAYLYDNMIKHTMAIDVLVGVIKSIIFGGIIAIVGCFKGMTCGEGAEGVGRATTEAVVYASITILISNFFLTIVLNKLLNLYG